MRLWRRPDATLAAARRASEIPEPQLVLLALPLQARQLRTQPIALRDPRRRSVGVVGGRVVFGAGRRKIALEPGDHRRELLLTPLDDHRALAQQRRRLGRRRLEIELRERDRVRPRHPDASVTVEIGPAGASSPWNGSSTDIPHRPL